MEPISSEVVDKTWERVASTSPRNAPKLVKRMTKEQPVILAYLLAVDNDVFNRDERELLLYLGVVVWQIMSQGSKALSMITEEILDDAYARNIKIAEYFQGESDDVFIETTRNIIGNYRQAEVLRYVVEAIMEEPEKGCHIRDDNMGFMLLDLKTVIDCFDAYP